MAQSSDHGRRTKPSLHQTVYTGTFIHSTSLTDLEVLENTIVGVNGNGIIEFLEQGMQEADVQDMVEEKYGWKGMEIVKGDIAGRGFWFPGFVDTHIHASQYPNTGIFGSSTLLSWLETYTFPLEASLCSLPKAQRVYNRCVARALSHGTTTAAYFATIHVPSTNLLADICLAKGQRAFIGRCNMDSHIHPEYYKDASAESAIEDTRATISYIKAIDPENKLITPILTPRFAPSCTPSVLSGLGAIHAETSLPIQTHISENTSEISLVKRLFPEYDSYAAVYDAHNLLTPKTVLAHAIHLTSKEVTLVKDRGSKISHCPVSNTCLSSGLCPVRSLLDAGIDVGLGTDVSGGWSPSILVAAREASSVSRQRAAISTEADDAKEKMKLSVAECLHLATRGGAKCLGLEKKVGGFEVGMHWDAQYVDLGAVVGMDEDEHLSHKGGVDLWGEEGWEEKVAKWVFCGDDRNTKAVWVAGRLVSGKMPDSEAI